MNKDTGKTKAQLLAELEELHKKSKKQEDKLKAANQQLEAHNQQLQATEQQLRAANQQLEASEDKYHSLFSELSEGVYLHEIIYDKKGKAIDYRIIEANTASEKSLNIKPEKAIGKLATELYVTKEAPFLEIYAKVAETGKPVQFEQYFPPMKKHFNISVYSPGKNKFATVFSDITEHKQAEAALRESEAKLRSIVENGSPVIFTIDKDGIFQLSEGKSLEVLGLKPGQVVGMSVYEIYKDYPAVLKGIKEALAGNTFRDVVQVGDVYFDVLYTPNRDDAGNFESIAGMAIDITERKRAETELIKLSTVVQQSPSIISITDTEGNIEYVNPKFSEITGYSMDEVIGENPRILKSGEQPAEVYEDIWNTITSGNTWRGELHNKKKNGDLFWEMAFISPIFDADGNIINYMKEAEDITQRKQIEKEKQDLQEQLNHKSKMDAIGALAGGMAHDFNNILSGIMSASQLLQLPKQGLNEKSLKYVDMILQASRRASDLIRKLLTFSHKGHVAKSTFNIHEVLKDIADILKGTIDKKITISLTKEAYNYNLIGDRSAIESVFLNLGINASHAMPDGGEIRINTKNIFLDQEYCDSISFTITPGDFIQIRIKDSGCGIPKENLQKIFDPFFTTNEQGKGTGLGLSTVYGTIENHHGAIEVNSKVGKGSTFYILLPCSQQLPQQMEEENQAMKGAGTILLVDDEEFNRILNGEILETLGYRVLLAADGQEAVEVFKEKHSEIDIVLMDMIMPGMNGSEAFYKMKEIDETCNVVIASGYTKDERIDELLENGVKGFIKKPYKISEISRVLGEVDNK